MSRLCSTAPGPRPTGQAVVVPVSSGACAPYTLYRNDLELPPFSTSRDHGASLKRLASRVREPPLQILAVARPVDARPVDARILSVRVTDVHTKPARSRFARTTFGLKGRPPDLSAPDHPKVFFVLCGEAISVEGFAQTV